MLRLGNYWIDEILKAIIQNRSTDAIEGVLDELNSASIEVTSDPTEITDHKGNVVRRIYRSKSATFNATNAYHSVVAQNLGSGSDIINATEENPVEMPKLEMVAAGGSITLVDPVEGSIQVQGMYKDGANGDVYTQSTAASYEDKTFGLVGNVLTVPAAEEGAPVQYVVFYQRNVKSGIKLINEGDKFPSTVKMTLYCSYLTACGDFAPCYVYIPSFQPSPETTVSLDSEEQTMDFSGDIQLDTCGTDKLLYAIYFPEENVVTTGVVEEEETP